MTVTDQVWFTEEEYHQIGSDGGIITVTGRVMYPMEPDPEAIDPYDIAHALGNVCRWAGHVKQFYSVAQHCVAVAGLVEPRFRLWALLHDATEAYVGDLIHPLKRQREFDFYREVEDRLMGAICERFQVYPDTMPAEVHEADMIARANERDALKYGVPGTVTKGFNPWTPVEAKWNYIWALQREGVHVDTPDGLERTWRA